MAVELREVSRNEWDGYLKEAPYVTPFHTRDWLESLETVHRAPWMPLGIFRDGDLIGLFPCFSVRKAFLKLFVSPLTGWATPYLGPLCPQDTLAEVIRAFLDLGKGADYVEVLSPPEVKFLPEAIERHTYILSLDKSVDELWKGLKRECRNRVRKAQKSGVEVEEVTSPEFFEDYIRMAYDVYAKAKRLPPIPISLFFLLWERLRPKGAMRVLAAKYKEEPVAAAVFLMYRDTVYFWDGVSYRWAYPLAPNNLLHWCIIKWAAQEGFRRYDMLGADIPGIGRFKSTFGPKLVSYPYLFRPLTLQGKLGRAFYKKMAPVARCLKYWLKGR